MISTLIKKNTENKSALSNYDVCQFSVEQLIELALKYSDDNEIKNAVKSELYSRGKDNIPERINIKKSTRAVVKNLESQINEEKAKNKVETKLLKNKFLSAVSLQDRLEILWVKHDHSVSI